MVHWNPIKPDLYSVANDLLNVWMNVFFLRSYPVTEFPRILRSKFPIKSSRLSYYYSCQTNRSINHFNHNLEILPYLYLPLIFFTIALCNLLDALTSSHSIDKSLFSMQNQKKRRPIPWHSKWLLKPMGSHSRASKYDTDLGEFRRI